MKNLILPTSSGPVPLPSARRLRFGHWREWVSGAGIALVLLGIAQDVHANGFRNPWEGTAGATRTGGRLTFTDDATAIVHNPANLSALSEPEFMAALSLGYSGTKFTGPDGRGGETKDPWRLLPSVFAVYPRSEKLVFGLGIVSPYGQFTKWEKDGPFAFTAPYFAELLTLDVVPAAALKVNENLSIGIGLDIMYSRLQSKQQIPFASITGIPTAPAGSGVIDVDGVGVGVHGGLTADLAERHRVAVVIKSPISIDYSGDFEVSRIPPPLMPPLVERTDFDTEVEFPFELGIGYGYRVRDDLRVGVDVEWIQSSAYDELRLDADANQMLLPGPSVVQDWSDNWRVGLGFEWDYTEHLRLYGGYLYMETPIPERTLAPTLTDNDRHVVSVGGRYGNGRHLVALGYAYTYFSDIEVENNLNPNYNGTYEMYAHLLSLCYQLTF